ncbi:MAG TPA: MarR family winged helix-turn-helix transcriptional regulator [Bdellovibrio sp.]|uniref:MarR family winged helix-turn-helix transcriptional regulator n=1 Tax=Bdellovibrio sp. TaxID=28201 RepID=UPI002EFD16FB
MTQKTPSKIENPRLPSRILRLPMYLMLTLTREGYRHAVRSDLKFRMPEYTVLAILEEFGPSDQRAIGERMGFDKSDVTKIINALESEGLVAREEDKIDKRRHCVALTAKGKRDLKDIGSDIEKSMRSFLRGLEPSEYATLTKLLIKAWSRMD